MSNFMSGLHSLFWQAKKLGRKRLPFQGPVLTKAERAKDSASGFDLNRTVHLVEFVSISAFSGLQVVFYVQMVASIHRATAFSSSLRAKMQGSRSECVNNVGDI